MCSVSLIVLFDQPPSTMSLGAGSLTWRISINSTLTARRPRLDNHCMAKVFFVLGCTGGGKAALARELASRIGGQIVSVDSMKVYRRMDIGTAKPTPQQQQQIPHHCIDIAEPSESFSVAQYLEHADRAIEQIHSAGSIPLAVGGTSLYIKAISEGLFKQDEQACRDENVRAELKARATEIGLEAMHEQLAQIDPEAAGRIHQNDERRIVRALEVHQITGKTISQLQKQWDSGRQRYDCVFVGIRRDKDDRNRRINVRTKRMIDAGLKDEVAALLAEPEGLSRQAAAAVGYAEMISHLRGEMTLEQTLEKIKINTRRLARKQRTWHRRWQDVIWFDVWADESVEHLGERVMSEIGKYL